MSRRTPGRIACGGRWAGGAAATIALVAGLFACGDSSDPPKPGWLTVTLQAPSTDDVALLFSVGGGPIDSVRSSATDVFARRSDAESWKVLVAGGVTAGPVAEIWVPDVGAAGYEATVKQVAARATYEQRARVGYALVVTSR